jgi:hypothetical protein
MSRIKENTDYESIFDDAVDEITTLVQSSYKSFKNGDLHRMMVANLVGKRVYDQSDRQTAAKLLATQIESSLLTPGVINGAVRRNKVMQHMVTEFCHTILGVDGDVASMRDFTPISPIDDGALKIPSGWNFGRRGSKPETKKEAGLSSGKKEGGFGFFRRKSEDNRSEGKSEKKPVEKKIKSRNYSSGDVLRRPEGEQRKNSAPALLENSDSVVEESDDEDEDEDDYYPNTPDSMNSNEAPVAGPTLTLKILKRDNKEVSDNRGNSVSIPQRGISKARLHEPGRRNGGSRSPRYEEAPRSAPIYGTRDKSLESAIKKASSKNSPPREARLQVRQVENRYENTSLHNRRHDSRSYDESSRRKESAKLFHGSGSVQKHERSAREQYIRQQHQDRNRGRSGSMSAAVPDDIDIFELYSSPPPSKASPRSKSASRGGRNYMDIPPPLDTTRQKPRHKGRDDGRFDGTPPMPISPISARGDSLRMQVPVDFRKGKQRDGNFKVEF